MLQFGEVLKTALRIGHRVVMNNVAILQYSMDNMKSVNFQSFNITLYNFLELEL